MNILIMSDNFLPGIGGMENAVLGLVNALHCQGHNILLICPHYNKKNEKDSEFSFEILRINSFKIDNNDYCAFPFYTKKIDDVVKKFKPDIIHCHSQASMLTLALKIKKKYNIPCVCTMHTKYSYCYKNSAKLNFIVKILCKMIGKKLKQVDQIIAVSKDMKFEFEKYGYNGDFIVIKNGANITVKEITDDIKNLANEKFALDKNENNLLFVGHISKVKNLDFIIDALEILNKTYDNFKMFFVGSGDNEKYFANRLKNSAIKNKIVFTGKITDRKLLSSMYYNSKLFLFPSTFDNDSLAIIEAATFNTPSITIKNTGSCERITDDKNGYVIENSPEVMAKKIEYLLTHQDELELVGKNASIDLPKSWEKASKEYLEIYKSVLNKKISN